MVRRPLMLLLAATSLTACDGFFELGDDGVPLIVATDRGRVARLDAGEDEATEAWAADVPDSSTVDILVDSQEVYVAAGDEVAAFDLSTGSAVWTAPHSFGVTVVRLAGPIDGILFALTFDDLVALDVASGDELWSQDLNLTLTDAADEALVADADTLVLGGDPIRSIDPTTGDVLQEFDAPDSDIRALELSGGVVYAGLADGLVALDSGSLTESWRIDTSAQVDNLTLGAGAVLYSILGGGLAAASLGGAPGGAAADGEIFQHVAVADSQYLGVRADGLLAAWDSEAFGGCSLGGDCATAWEVPPGSATVDALAVGTDAIYYPDGGILEAVASADGGALWSYQFDGNVVAAVAP